MAAFSLADIRARIARFPRVDLIHLPTPLRKLDALTAELGGPEIYIKRDDLTGLAFGGNKSRKLEFILADILEKKADTVITWGSLQSNWCLQTAAAARKYGVDPILVLFKSYDLPAGFDGNMLLERILDADIRIREARQGKIVTMGETIGLLNEIAGEERKKGRRPYIVPVGGSMVAGDMTRPLGAVSYVNAFGEMLEQTAALGFVPDAVIHATGSGGTQGGLLLGAAALTEGCRVVGISVSDGKEVFSSWVREIAEAADKTMGLGLTIGGDDIIVLDEYMKDGYGIVNKDVAEVIRLVFRTEGIVLDPVYTSKAMIGLVDLVRKGFFKKGERVVFFHTGGTPALFPNRDTLVEYLKS
ncbi:D-cysteine desulfhydrase family protein [bacterium]|nr:MAG: D-cysteine desulfhydrase family protein [bacterium]